MRKLLHRFYAITARICNNQSQLGFGISNSFQRDVDQSVWNDNIDSTAELFCFGKNSSQ